jgi:riboflavin synthase
MSFDIHEETWKKTNFHALMVGSLVNLERSMQLSDRLDGHMVQGHVEAVGVVRSMQALPLAPDGSNTGAILVCTVPDQLRHLLVPKGSVAINGVSLTIAEKIDHNNCSIALIPHTLAVTNLGSIKEGDLLNIETDILGRYVSAMLKHYPLPS